MSADHQEIVVNFVVALQVISEFFSSEYRLGNLVIIPTILVIVAIVFFFVLFVNAKVNIQLTSRTHVSFQSFR